MGQKSSLKLQKDISLHPKKGMSESPSHPMTDVCLPRLLFEIFPTMSSFWIVLFACLMDVVSCLYLFASPPSFVFGLRSRPLIWCLDDCVPLLAWLFCVCLCMSYLFVRVRSVQLTAPGHAGRHGRSVRCPVEAGTTNERAHARAPPLPMEGTSASVCIQRRPFATRTPVMVRWKPRWNPGPWMITFVNAVSRFVKEKCYPKAAAPLSVCTRYRYSLLCRLSINTHYYHHIKIMCAEYSFGQIREHSKSFSVFTIYRYTLKK